MDLGTKKNFKGPSKLLDSPPVPLRYFFVVLLFGLSFRFIGENKPLIQTVVTKVRSCVALHNPAPGMVAPL